MLWFSYAPTGKMLIPSAVLLLQAPLQKKSPVLLCRIKSLREKGACEQSERLQACGANLRGDSRSLLKPLSPASLTYHLLSPLLKLTFFARTKSIHLSQAEAATAKWNSWATREHKVFIKRGKKEEALRHTSHPFLYLFFFSLAYFRKSGEKWSIV